MPRIRMRALSATERTDDKTIMVPDSGPAFAGDGNIDYTCANCGVVLVKGAHDTGQIQNIFVECPECKIVNAVAGDTVQ